MKYHFFWSGADPLSNFYLFGYEYKGHTLTCSEQGYMWEKAMYFEDYEMANKILMLKEPAYIKKAGKLVKGFDTQIWNSVSYEKMYQVCLEKFLVPELTTYLINTSDETLVEASPYDGKWGIKLSASEAKKTPEHMWPGENRLGKVLMDVREKLKTK